MIAVVISMTLLLAVLAIVSYVSRLYTEMGKFLSREFQENIEFFEQRVEPRFGPVQSRAALSFFVLTHILIAAVALVIAYPTFHQQTITLFDIVKVVATVVLAVVVFHHLLPYVLFVRTRGEFLSYFTPLLIALIYLAMPVTLVLGFCISVVSLSKENGAPEPESQQEAVDALIEAGQEEGILEESDRDLIHSVVEFGDKTVREVMTARPQVMAVPVDMTVEKFTELLRENPYSRVPVYEGALDNIKGIVFAHDVLQVADEDARTRTVGSLMRDEVMFVPESKRGSDLLRDMQKENLHMAIVIDEYGGVAGLVTIEDLLEEIVGEIRDEHEGASDIVRESETSYVVPGNTDVDLLDQWFGIRLDEVEATTVGGVVSELLGRIPRPGETVQEDGLKFETLQSTDRRVELVRVSLIKEGMTEQIKGGQA